MSWDLPERGVVFWPVGNGDAATIAVNDSTVLQVDINHRDAHDLDDDDRVPVVDRLLEVLPLNGDGDPYLSVLAITHHDLDHCSGFSRLCKSVAVNELWLTLRSFVEDKNDLHDEGAAIYEEAMRRRDMEIDAHNKGKRAEVGDRLRVIGYADLLEDEDWKSFPAELNTIPGNFLNVIDGVDREGDVEIFIHTPFRSDTEDGSRNSSSLGLQVTLHAGDCSKSFLMLGDLEYQQVEAFVDRSKAAHAEQLEWDFLLAPHHCSRNAIRYKSGEGWEDARALADLAAGARNGARVVVSSRSFDSKSEDDTDPPHEDARDAYTGIVGKGNVLMTADYENGSDSDPITIAVDDDACGELRATSSFREKLTSVTVIPSSQVRPGDRSGARRDQEFA